MAAIKTKIYAGTLFLGIFLLLLDTSVSAEREWTYLFARDGIEVYRKTFPETSVCAFKGVGYVDAGMAVVSSVIQDIPAYPRWMARCKESVVLKAIDPNTRIFYSVVDSPRPFKDRDMVLSNKTIYKPEKGLAEITFDLCELGEVPPRDKYFRVTELSGKYLLEYVDHDKTRVTVVYQGDPGGNIPVNIVNWLESKHYPHAIIMGLRQMVKRPEYITSLQTDRVRNED